MIYICADDYGLCSAASACISECAKNGSLNKISIFPNFECGDLSDVLADNDVELSLHLNLVEGMALSNPQKVNLLTDDRGRFKYTFAGLYLLSLIKPKKFECAVYEELKAQISFWQKHISKGLPVLIDSHQHTHMIPSVFKMLIKVLTEQNIEVKYLRIPAEPILPFIKTPSLYLTYSPVNIIKQWLLKFFWLADKKEYKKLKLSVPYFFGILFSGNMDEKRVRKVLPHYLKLANKSNRDLEILFHPGYINDNESSLGMCNKSFEKFYYSNGRKTEFDAVMNLNIKNDKKEVLKDAVH